MAAQVEGGASSDRLESWKEISAFFGRGVTTVQRWEQEEGLPIRRQAHAKRGSVYAHRSELEAWRQQRSIDPAEVATTELATPELPGVTGAAVPPTRLSADGAPDAWPTAPAATPPSIAPARQFGVGVAIAAVSLVGIGLVFSKPNPTTARPVEKPLPRILVNDEAHETYPTLSPDGQFVAYRWSRADAPGIYISPTSKGAPHALAVDLPQPVDRKDSFPKWSPDGKWIAFLRELGNSVWDVRVVPAIGGVSTKVTKITSGSVSWMPDSRTLAVVDRPAAGDPYAVFMVSVESGMRVAKVTSPEPGTFGDWHCAVSPDGLRVAVARFRSDFDADVYVTTLAGGEAAIRRLTHDAIGVGHMEWTPDGHSIVFTSYRTGRASIWQIPAEPMPDQLPTLVAGAEGGAQHPTVSHPRNATTASLVYNLSGDAESIWRWDIGRDAHAEPRPILATGLGSIEHPAWSPDGSRVAFVSNKSGTSEVWLADENGGDPHQLTFRDAALTLQPRWSPDGLWILFTSIATGHQDVYKVRVDGTDAARVSSGSTDARNGEWSRDGRWVYFRSNRDGTVRVWRTDADNRREPVPATRGDSSEATESLDGRVLYFTKPFEAGLWQKPLPDGPETLLVPDWHVREGFWAVTRKGILVIERQVVGSRSKQPVSLYSFATESLVPVGTLPVMVNQVRRGIAVTPDGSLLWAQAVTRFSDLMILNNAFPSGSVDGQK